MIIDPIFGRMDKAICVPDNVVLDETFVVKVHFKEMIVGTQHYETFPTDEQIMWCIKEFNGDCATVEKKYTLGQIPFTEEEKWEH